LVVKKSKLYNLAFAPPKNQTFEEERHFNDENYNNVEGDTNVDKLTYLLIGIHEHYCA